MDGLKEASSLMRPLRRFGIPGHSLKPIADPCIRKTFGTDVAEIAMDISKTLLRLKSIQAAPSLRHIDKRSIL